MNKQELVRKIAEDTKLTISQVSKSLDAFIDATVSTVQDGEKVSLIGFGTFSMAERSERKGRNPRTGEEITIPASKVPKFSAGKAFKEACNVKPQPKAKGKGGKKKTKKAS